MNDAVNVSEIPSLADTPAVAVPETVSENGGATAPTRRKAATKTTKTTAAKTATAKTTRAKKDADSAPKTTRTRTTRVKKDASVSEAASDSQPALQFASDENHAAQNDGNPENNGNPNSAPAAPSTKVSDNRSTMDGESNTPNTTASDVSAESNETRAPEINDENRDENRNDARNAVNREEQNTSDEQRDGDNARSDQRGDSGRNDSRNARFRGREGRDGRNDTARNDNNSRGNNPRGDNRNENARGNNPRNDNSRGGNRNDNSRGDNRGNRNDNRGETRGMDRVERDAMRARPDYDFVALEAKTVEELNQLAQEMEVETAPEVEKRELVARLLEAQAAAQGFTYKRGVLEILPDSRGFLRVNGYLAGDGDVYVSSSQIKRFNLKTGDMVTGQARFPKDAERHFGLLRVEAINDEAPDNLKSRKDFEKLTPIFPEEKWNLETEQSNITARIIELVSPIGKGQRGLIVAPPKAGKTTLIKSIANSISRNHPEAILIVLLIDERPEEVTDISRSVRGEVVASTFDETAENHMRVAEMVMERAKRLAEQKHDVVILLDSITRLSRASNLVVPTSGRTMSGGLDPAAMHKPKKMFGAARNIEEGGSLTILATALVDTGSRMDEYIFEEFKGTGNLDLVLDRSLFDQRIFPAIDINRSGTRRDDLLLSKEDLATVYHLRRTLANLDNDKAITLLIDRLRNTKTNADFMQIVAKSAKQGQIQNP